MGVDRDYLWRKTYLSGKARVFVRKSGRWTGSEYIDEYRTAHAVEEHKMPEAFGWSDEYDKKIYVSAVDLKYNYDRETIDIYVDGQYAKTTTSVPSGDFLKGLVEGLKRSRNR